MSMTTEPTSSPAAEARPLTVGSQAPSKLQRPFAAAAKVVKAVQLTAIHFSAFSAQALEASEAIHEDANLSASTKFLTPAVALMEGGFSTKTTLLFEVGGKPSEGETSAKTYAVIRATIEAAYSLKPDQPEFSEDDLKDYALCYCPFHVWGYWREFVQSSLARLDLPQLTIPLFLIAQAPQMVQDKLE